MPTDSPSSSTDPFAKTHEALYALVQELSSKQALELDLVDVKALIDKKGAVLLKKLRQEYIELHSEDREPGG
jgi:hypothetical protein